MCHTPDLACVESRGNRERRSELETWGFRVNAPLLPPKPPSVNPAPDKVQRIILATLVGLGIVLTLAGLLEWLPYPDLVQRGGLFLVIYALLVAASWLPAGGLSQRVDKLLDDWVGKASSGWYGVMGIATFTKLELESILKSLRDFDPAHIDWSGAVMQWLMGFSLESLLNAVWASIWPFLLISNRGVAVAGTFIAATWAIYWCGGKLLPHGRIEAARERKLASKTKSNA